MRIALGSDLHLEFGELNFPQPPADVLVLCGDILVAQDLYKSQRHETPSDRDLQADTVHRRAKMYRDFLQKMSETYKFVLYVMGNHEHYNGVWERTQAVLEDEFKHYHNIYLLQNSGMKINDIAFLGCTLWTNINRENHIDVYRVCREMNDYVQIRRDGYRRLTTQHTLFSHHQSMEWLTQEAPKHPKVVVLTHMAPHPRSCNPRYVDDVLNSAYHSNLDDWIYNHPNVGLWCHGHTHHPFDYMAHNTHIVCNPRGYKGHDADPNYQFKIYEL